MECTGAEIKVIHKGREYVVDSFQVDYDGYFDFADKYGRPLDFVGDISPSNKIWQSFAQHVNWEAQV